VSFCSRRPSKLWPRMHVHFCLDACHEDRPSSPRAIRHFPTGNCRSIPKRRYTLFSAPMKPERPRPCPQSAISFLVLAGVPPTTSSTTANCCVSAGACAIRMVAPSPHGGARATRTHSSATTTRRCRTICSIVSRQGFRAIFSSRVRPDRGSAAHWRWRTAQCRRQTCRNPRGQLRRDERAV